MRTLFTVTAALGALFALANVIGESWTALIVWCLVLVAAHVSGNRIGHRSRALRHTADTDTHVDVVVARDLAAAAAREPEELCSRSSPIRWARQCIGCGCGAAVGAMMGLGGSWLIGMTSWNGLVLATVSVAVLGGLFAFLTTNFIAVAASAWEEACQTAGQGTPVRQPAPSAESMAPPQRAGN